MKPITYDLAQSIFTAKGYKFYTKVNSLNIFGIRNKNRKSNAFDDFICIAYIDSKGLKQCKVYEGTTNAGLPLFTTSVNKNGVAILPYGQHTKLFKKGFHKGEYEALVQNTPISVIRDNNNDGIMDFDSKNLAKPEIIGLNLHHANDKMDSTEVNNWSHACQVIRKIKDWKEFLSIVNISVSLYGDEFTYTLFKDIDFE